MPSATITLTPNASFALGDLVDFIDWAVIDGSISNTTPTSFTISGTFDGAPAIVTVTGTGFVYQSFFGQTIVTAGTINQLAFTHDGVAQGTIDTSISVENELQPVIIAEELGGDPTALEDFFLGFNYTYNGSDAADIAPAGTLIGDGVPFNPRGNDVFNLNGGNDNVFAGDGNDTINGGVGADTMFGGFGNDIYHVDNASDVVSEAGGGGIDKVFSSVSFTLATGLENLQLNGASAINGTGNGVNNVINGNAAANVINGLAGGDTMFGAGGNDTYHVDNLFDKVFESAGGGTDKVFHSVNFNVGAQAIENLQMTGTGNISVVGGTANNIINGNSGNNFFDGREGSDNIFTGAGNDFIRFSTALGATNVDTVSDFNAPTDQLQLVQAIFGVLPLGGLAAAAFKDLTAGAVDATDRIIYDRTNGDLFYDQDGSGGGFAQIKFADLSNNALISNADFVVI